MDADINFNDQMFLRGSDGAVVRASDKSEAEAEEAPVIAVDPAETGKGPYFAVGRCKFIGWNTYGEEIVRRINEG